VQTLRIEVQGLHSIAGRTSGKIRERQQILFGFARSILRMWLASSLLPLCGSQSLLEAES